MAEPKHRHRAAPRHPIDYTGLAALGCIAIAGAMALTIVWRQPRGETLAVLVSMVGSFLAAGTALLAERYRHGRATDPEAHPGAAVSTSTTVTPPEPDPDA
jgi:hypothetical protein